MICKYHKNNSTDFQYIHINKQIFYILTNLLLQNTFQSLCHLIGLRSFHKNK